MIRIARLVWPYLRVRPWAAPGIIVLGILASLAEGLGITLMIPLLESVDGPLSQSGHVDRLQAMMRGVLDGVPAGERLPAIAALIVGLTLCKSLLTYGHSALAASFSADLTHRIRSQVFMKVMGISQSRLDAVGSGRLINLLATDTWHTSDALSLFIGLVINCCSIAVFSVLLLALSWKLTLLVVAGMAVVSVVLRMVTGAARRLGKDGVKANTTLSEHMVDALYGLREIQMFGLEAHRGKLFERASEGVRRIFLRLDLLQRAIPPLSEFLYIGLILGLLLMGVAGEVSVSTIMVFLLMLYRLQPHFRQADSNRLSLASLARSVEDVADFCPTDEQPLSATASPASRALQGDIRFDQVGFYYRDERDLALDGVSLEIPEGRITAIVGPSGSGKTTLISLLCGFYTPSRGEILVGGRALSNADSGLWREQIAWVCQHAHIFGASVRENIRYGRLDATDDEVVEAAQRADAHGFISELEGGYDTKVGNGGVQLSSGQMQRIALARAFLRRPNLLILDEATNALDSFSEDIIQAFLRDRSAGQTVVVISHRLSTLKHADHAVVLDNGRVVETGSPQDLGARRGLFSRLKELQHVG